MNPTDQDYLWAEIDLGCIRRNAERLKLHLDPGGKLLAVVKAGGYGHGDVESAEAAIAGGADWLGVARVGEAEPIRAAGLDVPILLLAEPPPAAIPRAIELDVTPTLYTERTATLWNDGYSGERPLAVHIKVDTGMRRYGVAPADLESYVDLIGGLPGLRVRGIWSHFAVAEDALGTFTKQQYETFMDVVESLGDKALGLIRHLSNSAATLSFRDAHLDLVRCGIAIYGIAPAPELAGRLDLEPAMTLKSRVGLVKRVKAGESLSYGQRYCLEKDGLVATIPCGYADGLRRGLSNKGEVLIREKRYPICGSVTMDHFLVNAGDDAIEAGDEVVIIGTQGSETISAQQIADTLETIPYEIVCGVSSRVRRVYKQS